MASSSPRQCPQCSFSVFRRWLERTQQHRALSRICLVPRLLELSLELSLLRERLPLEFDQRMGSSTECLNAPAPGTGGQWIPEPIGECTPPASQAMACASSGILLLLVVRPGSTSSFLFLVETGRFRNCRFIRNYPIQKPRVG